MKFNNRFLVKAFSAFALVGLISTGIASTAEAAPKPAIIVVVNTQQLFGQSKVGTSLRTQLEAQSKKLDAEGRKAEADLQAEAQKLGEQRSLLSPEDLQKRVAALQKKQTSVNTRMQKKSQDLQAASAKARGEIEKAVRPIFVDVMKKHGANMMLDQSAVLANGSETDVTAEVLQALDAKITTVAVKP